VKQPAFYSYMILFAMTWIIMALFAMNSTRITEGAIASGVLSFPLFVLMLLSIFKNEEVRTNMKNLFRPNMKKG